MHYLIANPEQSRPNVTHHVPKIRAKSEIILDAPSRGNPIRIAPVGIYLRFITIKIIAVLALSPNFSQKSLWKNEMK
jgi:hypothetical protein